MTPNHKRKKLLVVEDESIIALGTKMTLEEYGYSVQIVHRGEAAVKAVVENPDIDLILMDINLGSGMDGTEAAALILKSRDLPVVFLSSHTEPEVVEKTEKITSYGYVVKDSGGTVLDASIKMAFKLFAAKISEMEKEKSLRESEGNYRILFHEMMDGFALHEIILDESGQAVDYRFLAVNPAFERFTGLKADQLIGRTVLEVLPGTEAYWIERYGRVALTGEPASFESYSSEFDKTFEVKAFRFKPGQFACIFVDVTESKRANALMRESEERYKAVFENSLDAILLTAPDGRILEANAAAERMFGRPADEIIRLGREGITDVTDPRLPPALEERARTGRFRGELTYFRKDGTKFPAEVSSVVFKDREGHERTSMIIRDMTERRLVEEALRRRNQYIESILDNMPIGFAANTIDDGAVRYLNRRFTEIYGWPREVLTDVDRFFACVYPGPEGEKLKARVMEDMQSGDPARMIWSDLRITTQSGENRYISAQNIPILEQNLMVSTVWDVTDMHRSQDDLREAEARYRMLFESSPDGIVIIDQETMQIRMFNDTACRQLGCTREEFMGLSVSDIDVLETPEETRAHIDKIVREGSGEFTTRHRTRQGEIREVKVWARYSVLNGRPIYHCVWRDITGLKRRSGD